ncbi:MAG: hypothetical protein IMZ46_06975 [Acidobacteria bacterium]|nr:hypothetical protein [Acidobacteriota bacterium]
MSKQKGKGASPAKHIPQARPLLVTEILTLCGGNTMLAGELMNESFRQYKRGKKNFAKLVLETLLKGDKIIRSKEFKQIDNNRATRVLRHVAKRMTERQVQQAQPAA